MRDAKEVWISGASLRLSGLLWAPERRNGDSAPAAVLCHPHPLHGGDQRNSVLAGLRLALVAAGWHVLTFDFRGVSQSQGTYGEGIGEADDAAAALACLSSLPDVDSQRVLLAGYSFGAWAGLRAVGLGAPVGAVAMVAPPLGLWDFAEARGLGIPLLAVVGDRDAYCPPERLAAWSAGAGAAAEVSLVAGADHFFAGREAEVGDVVTGFARRRLPRA